MIKKILRYIRQKPKAVREQYAFWIACLVTAAVALVWMSQFFTPAVVEPKPAEVEVVTTPDSLSGFMGEVQSSFNEAKDEIKEAALSLPTATTSASNSIVSTNTQPIQTSHQEVRISTSTQQ